MFSLHALAVLEFGRIREALSARTATGMGLDQALALSPTSEPERIKTQLAELEDALFGATLNLGGISDIRPTIANLGQSQTLGLDLLQIAYVLEAAFSLKESIEQRSRGPLLALAEKLADHSLLAKTILRRLDQSGNVKDSASDHLAKIRRRLGPLRAEIRNKLSSSLERFGEALQDRLVTIRRERYVIPVKANLEHLVPGIVVDASASAQTVFVEPQAVIGLNNELARLILEEEEEVRRILAELVQMVGEESGLWLTLETLGQLDLIAAKARLVRDWQLSKPEISPLGTYEINSLAHPLIKDCLPNDLRLDGQQQILLITGPNMGGKTVTLKSLGLAVLMHQAGLYVKATSAKLPLVEDILADIGDEQSIEASLSTFAAHLKNLGEIVNKASPKTLVLIDELGSGTDPIEGAALAQALIEKLLAQDARGIITSHLSPLKAFASQRQDVQNAAMGFDLETLAPTYQLRVGQPGRSYALSIADRLGFAADVLARSQEILGPEGQKLERLLEQLERDRDNLSREIKVAQEMRESALGRERAAQERVKELEIQREEILEAARQRAEELYQQAFDQVRQLRHLARDENARPKVLQDLRQLRAAVQASRPQRVEAQQKSGQSDELKPGMSVGVPAYSTSGTVLEIRGDEVVVQMGLLKMTLKKRDLKLKRSQISGQTTKTPVSIGKSSFERELNLRGRHVEEAIEEVRTFIAEAKALKESPVRILHGKGQGVLRRLIRDYLKTDRTVESFHDAQPYEGGHGVTVVHLKQ